MDFNGMKGSVRDRTLMVILELLYVYLWFYLRGNNVTSSFCCYGTGTATHYGLDLRNIHQDMRNEMKGIDVNTQNIAFIHLKCLLVCDCSAST